MSASLPSGTVTFLFTDLEGSTKLWERYPGAMKTALARHDELVRQAIEHHGGHVIKNTGDGFHAVFDAGANGVAAALAAQQSLCHAAWDEIQPHSLRARMALHTGEAQERSGDYYGPTLNRAARLMSVANGGQTLISTTTADLVRDQLPEGASIKDLGEHRLRDLVRSERIFQLTHPALPSDFPPIRSIDAYPNNLPVQLTTFIGREKELADAKTKLHSTHLLTLIGPGGTGKTRLALQLAADVLPSFADGVWLAELAPLTDPSLVVQTVGSLFHLREQLGMPLNELLIDYLREKELLLVLDNCEHLIDACAQLADQLLRSCAHLKIIASSREALGIAGETVYRVPPLSLPEPQAVLREDLERCESAQLFIERAAAANRKFGLTQQNVPAVAQICRRLDGIPLALELAAARVTAFSPEQIASHLDDRFRLLTGGSRTALPRQQTLRALIDWSYELLSEDERTVLRKLSVFSNGWTFEAAEAVCADLNVLDLLPQLVNKSLVAVDTEAEEPRFRLLETVRQYARDKMLESGDVGPTRNAHFDYFYHLAEKSEPILRSRSAGPWLARLEMEHDNLRSALQWGLDERSEDVLRMLQWLAYFWNHRGYEEEARKLLQEAIQSAERQGEPEGQAGRQRRHLIGEAWNIYALMAYSQGDNLRAMEASEKTAAIAREFGDYRLLALGLSFEASASLTAGNFEHVDELLKEAQAAAKQSGDPFAIGLPVSMVATYAASERGDYEGAQAALEQGRALLRQSGDEWGATMGLLASGMVARYRGDFATARKYFVEIETAFRELGDQHRVNMARSEVAHMERLEGHWEEAERQYRDTILEWQRLGHRAAVAHQLECFALVEQHKGRFDRAARLLGAAEALRERIRIDMAQHERKEYEAAVAELRSQMEEAAFASNWAQGRQLNMEQAIRFALNES